MLNGRVTLMRLAQIKMPKQPDCKWAQRPDKIMLTLNVPNLDPVKSDIKVCVAHRRATMFTLLEQERRAQRSEALERTAGTSLRSKATYLIRGNR